MTRKSRAKFIDSKTTGKHSPTCRCHICSGKKEADRTREKIREVLKSFKE